MGLIKADKIIFLQSTLYFLLPKPQSLGGPTLTPPKIRINIIEFFWPTSFFKR